MTSPHKRNIAVLGSTGSIGTQTLDVIARHPDLFRASLLVANTSWQMLAEQALRFRPEAVCIANEGCYAQLREALAGSGIEVHAGAEAIEQLAAEPQHDTVIAAMVGYSGLPSVLAAAKAGKRIALANKETLVAAGELVTDPCERHGAELLPVDSEHSAIFQCLTGREGELHKILLTGSGGPFRGRSREELRNVTRAQALDHPNWKMGAKISIDSATMMNKALEVVEAFHLYGVPLEKITVLVHPQSLVHSLVQFTDGSQLAQLGTPDMRIPIAACLFWPRCVDTGVPPLDLVKAGTLQFFAPDDEAFPALKLARRALRERGGMSVVMNAANEAAVELFLAGKCAFADIAELVSAAMDAHAASEPGHEPFCPPLSCSGDDSLALEREVTILTERMSRLDLKTRELVKQLARAGVDEC